VPALRPVFRAAAASSADWFQRILAVPAILLDHSFPHRRHSDRRPATIVALIAAGILFADLSHASAKATPPRPLIASSSPRLSAPSPSLQGIHRRLRLHRLVLVFRRIWQPPPRRALAASTSPPR